MGGRSGGTDAKHFELATAYAFGISKAHAFIDGNKRTAFVSAITFMRLSGYSFRPASLGGVRMMEDLASSQLSAAMFARWLEDGAKPI